MFVEVEVKITKVFQVEVHDSYSKKDASLLATYLVEEEKYSPRYFDFTATATSISPVKLEGIEVIR